MHRTSLILFAIALLALFAWVGQMASVEAERESLEPTGLEGESVASLIERLAELGTEWIDDAELGYRTLAPSSVELGRRLDTVVELTDEQWSDALVATPVIGYRTTWAAEEPFTISMNAPRWLGNAEIRLTPRDERLSSVSGGILAPSCGLMYLVHLGEQQNQLVGWLGVGEHELLFDVEIERGASPDFDTYGETWVPSVFGPDILWEGEFTLHVTVLEHVADAVPPVQGPELDAWVRSALSMDRGATSVRNSANSEPTLVQNSNAYIRFAAPSDVQDSFHDVSMRLILEFKRGGILYQRHKLFSPPSDWSEEERSRDPFDRGGAISIDAVELESASDPWMITVTGSDEGVLDDTGTKRHYAGSFVVPARELIARGTGWSE